MTKPFSETSSFRDRDQAKFTGDLYDQTSVRVVATSQLADVQLHDIVTSAGFLTDENGDLLAYSHFRSFKADGSETIFFINYYDSIGAQILTAKVDFEATVVVGGVAQYSVQKMDPLPIPFSIFIEETGFLRIGTGGTGLPVAYANLSGGTGPLQWEVITSTAGTFVFEPNTNKIILAADYTDPDTEITLTLGVTDANGLETLNQVTVTVGEALPLSSILLNTNLVVDTLPANRFVANISAIGGVAPYTFVITEDPSAKFKVVNDTELWTDGVIDIADVDYAIVIEATDFIGQKLEQPENITVDPALVNADSLSFNGTDQLFAVPKTLDTEIERDRPFSFVTWFNRASTGTSDTLFCNFVSSSNNSQGFIAYFDANAGNRLNVHLSNAGNNQLRARFTLGGVGTWQHIVITYDGSSDVTGVKCYLDGVAVALTSLENGLTDTVINSDESWYIGARGNNSQNSEMLVDSTRRFTKELSQIEIDEIYNLGAVRDQRLESTFQEQLYGFDWEGDFTEVKNAVRGTYANEDGTTFSTDVP